jgi:hypothetical protein
MRSLAKIVLAFACLAVSGITAHASEANIYIAQNAAGAANGADCADAKPVSFFNTAGNWGSGSAQIGPGTTVHLCGTFTGAAGSTMLTIQGSGSSGSPIRILFEAGTQLNAPYWGANPWNGGPGAVTCNGQSYITIDGGTNGVIQNTANGTGLANQQPSTGIFASRCPHFTVQGFLTINNIYVSANGDTLQSGADLWVQDSDNFSITGATLRYAFVPLVVAFDPGYPITGGSIANNTIDYGCHIVYFGDNNNNASASGVAIHDNMIGPHTDAFNQSNQGCHQDGLFLQAVNSGSTISNFQIYNNTIESDMCSSLSLPGYNCTAPVFFAGSISNTQFFNNVVKIVAPQSEFEGLVNFALDTGQTGSGVAFYNNTFDQNGACQGLSATCGAVKLQSAGTQTNVTIENNIFTGGDNYHAAIDNATGLALSSKIALIDHNDYWNYSNIGYDGSSNTTYQFAKWKAAGYDVNGSAANPLLTATFLLQPPSSILGLGQNLSNLGIDALDRDKAGNSRPTTGTWTPGAYQQSGSGPTPPQGLVATVQ